MLRTPTGRAFLAALVLAVSSVASTARAQVFTRVDTGTFEFETSNASGASWVDYDGDGDEDIFTSNRDTGNFIFRNDGGGAFTRVLAGGLTIQRSVGNCWADFDNDGDQDVMLAGTTSALYRNNGGGNFTVWTTALVPGGTDFRAWSCAWADYDNDGFVDLFVAHPAGFSGTPNLKNFVFHNSGDGTFERITDSPIVSDYAPFTVGTWSDYDLDGDIDLFIGSGPADGTRARDFLYRNLLTETGTAEFERIDEAPIGTDLVDGQVWNWIDIDNDGDLDAHLTNYWGGYGSGMPDRLYRNDSGTLVSISTGPLVTDPGFSLGAVWADFDNDGDLDAFVAKDAFPNGAANRYYENNGDGTFLSKSLAPLTSDIEKNWNATASDYDGDGDLDLFVPGIADASKNSPHHLYRNDLPAGNHWLKIQAVGTTSNRSGIGARLRARASIGGEDVVQQRDVSSQNTFNGMNSLIAHFGLGDAASIDELTVEWPSGTVDTYGNVEVDRLMVATEGETAGALSGEAEPTLPHEVQLAQNYPNPFRDQTRIAFTLSSPSQVWLTVFNAAGRPVGSVSPSASESAGRHEFIFSGRGLASGPYFYRLDVQPHGGAAAYADSGVMTLIR